MAELVSIKRNVDVSPGQAAPAVFHCSQGDVGSKIILGLLNNGTAYAIPSGVTVTIEGSESNGSIFTPISATASGSDITFYLTGEMTAVAGPTICQAVLKSGSNILGTANFTLEVESSPMGADAPPVFTDAGWTWMLNKLNTEFVPALDDNIIDAIDSKADQSDLTALSNTVTGELTDIKADLLALEQEGYPYASIQEAVNTWADDHNVSIVNPFVIPQMYGAKGDGVSDDYNAFVATINSMNDGDVLYVPNGKYLLSATLSITKNILIYCDGELSVSHSSPVIVLDSLSNALIKINTIKKSSRVFDYVEGSVNYSIGVVLKNCDTCIVDINNILNTTTGIVLLGEVNGCHYNEISCNNVHTFTGIEIIRSSSGGWVNGNVINKFRWMINTWGDNSNLVSSYMVKSLSYAASGESEPYKNNANVFHNLSAEYGAASADYPISLVRLNYARGYTFDFNRVEILAKSTSLYDNFFYFTNSFYCIATIWFSINSYNTNIGTGYHNCIYEKSNYESLKKNVVISILPQVQLNSKVSYTEYWFTAVLLPAISSIKLLGELIVNSELAKYEPIISNLPTGRPGYGGMVIAMGTTEKQWDEAKNVTFHKLYFGGQNREAIVTIGDIPAGTRLFMDVEFLVDDSAINELLQ